MIVRVASVLAVTCALGAGSCIVTDKIEFEDYVNNPPQVTSVDPPNTYIDYVCKKDHEFKVYVWDPDEGDAASYAAKLNMWVDPLQATAPIPLNCTVGGVTTTEHLEEYETGVQLSVKCLIDLKLYEGLQEGSVLLLQVEVSDKGYNQSTLPEGARTADVVWVREVGLDVFCEGQQ